MISIPLSLSQMGMEPSRSFTQGQHPLFPQPGGNGAFQELPGVWLTRALPNPPDKGESRSGALRRSCSAPSPWVLGIKAALAHTQQDAG